jgi:hypothetical protein
MSTLLPKFLRDLDNSAISTVFLTGCGGGFDFVHSLCLIPELKRLGKKFVIGSYSFGDPQQVRGEVIFASDDHDRPIIAKRVTAESSCSDYYCPEVGICSYLDQQYPDDAPHFVYAYYARHFPIHLLTSLHNLIIEKHSIDGIILIDGGSDSLMKGDEAGLGDPIEDAVSVATVAGNDNQRIIYKVLISIGIGTDRFNDVSDCSTLRAIAEITRLGGFLGSVSLESARDPYNFYKLGLEHLYNMQSFRSVLAGSILASGLGFFGSEEVPEMVQKRVKEGSLFLWPLMSMLWAFDVNIVAARSLIVGWIKECKTCYECAHTFDVERQKLAEKGLIREVEELPRHVDYSCLCLAMKKNVEPRANKLKHAKDFYDLR